MCVRVSVDESSHVTALSILSCHLVVALSLPLVVCSALHGGEGLTVIVLMPTELDAFNHVVTGSG